MRAARRLRKSQIDNKEALWILAANGSTARRFDPITETPFFNAPVENWRWDAWRKNWPEGSSVFQVWYDDAQSLRIKYERATALAPRLGGLGVWCVCAAPPSKTRPLPLHHPPTSLCRYCAQASCCCGGGRRPHLLSLSQPAAVVVVGGLLPPHRRDQQVISVRHRKTLLTSTRVLCLCPPPTHPPCRYGATGTSTPSATTTTATTQISPPRPGGG